MIEIFITLRVFINLFKAQIIQQDPATIVLSFLQAKELHKLLYNFLAWWRNVVILV